MPIPLSEKEILAAIAQKMHAFACHELLTTETILLSLEIPKAPICGSSMRQSMCKCLCTSGIALYWPLLTLPISSASLITIALHGSTSIAT